MTAEERLNVISKKFDELQKDHPHYDMGKVDKFITWLREYLNPVEMEKK